MLNALKSKFFTGASLGALAATLALAATTTPASAIIVRDDVGLANSFDAGNQWSAVAQIFRQDNATGGIFFNCTGTLINPRTVLTAAHCVNDRSSEAYGTQGAAANTMLIGFGPDTSGALFGYIGAGGNLPYSLGGVASSTDVIIHPSANLDNGGLPFPWADVALIALDEPVSDIQPMSLLLSPLDALTHVVLGGYGTVGTGDTGTQGIGFQRIIGENELGLIGSSADLLDGVFPGFAPTALTFGAETQTLYFVDFDDPTRTPEDTANCSYSPTGISCTDINAARAVDWFGGDALPNEVGTAGGDSGSAMIADQIADFPLIVGVLSGGFDFFGLGNQYSDISFYNPLFPFHEFLTANTPYKYVSALPGDGDWMDPGHWTQDLDPGFFVYDETGAIVNGVPGGSEDGVYTTTPKIGAVLGTDISGNSTDPSPFLPPRDAGGDAVDGTYASLDPVDGLNSKPAGQIIDILGGIEPSGGYDGLMTTEALGADDAPAAQDAPGFGNNLPQSSVLQGPGSTGFVPNNTDGTPGTAFDNPAQYFDVTLSATGTTTLSGADVEIDRLTMLGGGAGLDIADDASLTSLIDVQLLMGSLNVDGWLATPWTINDFGILSGTGGIDTYYLLNRGGIVAPGSGNGTVRSLTVTGDFEQLGQGVFWVDVENAGAGRLAVGGAAYLDGTLMATAANPLHAPRGSRFTILTAGDGVYGTFANTMTQYSAVLSFDVDYGADSVALDAVAADYQDVIGAASPQAIAVAAAFDAATDPDALPGGDFGSVIASLDALPTADVLSASLHSINPADTFLFDQFAFQTSRALGRTLTERAGVRRAGLGNGYDSSALNLAADKLAFAGADASVILAAANASMAAEQAENGHPWGGANGVPQTIGVFIAGDLTYAEVQGVNDDYDVENYWFTAGADTHLGENLLVGVAANYGSLDADEGVEVYQGTTYGLAGYASAFAGAFYANAYLGYNWMDLDSRRSVLGGVQSYTAEGDADATQFMAGFDAGAVFMLGEMISAGPIVRLRHASFDLDGYSETGASIYSALLPGRTSEQTLLGIGGNFAAQFGGDTTVFGRITYENDLSAEDAFFTTAALVSAGDVEFAVEGMPIDDEFFTLGGGIASQVSYNVSLQASFETDIERDYAKETSVSVGMKVGF